MEPVILYGEVELITDMALIEPVLKLENAKYNAEIPLDFLDPAVNASFRLRPRKALSLKHDDFSGSPTRWRF